MAKRIAFRDKAESDLREQPRMDDADRELLRGRRNELAGSEDPAVAPPDGTDTGHQNNPGYDETIDGLSDVEETTREKAEGRTPADEKFETIRRPARR